MSVISCQGQLLHYYCCSLAAPWRSVSYFQNETCIFFFCQQQQFSGQIKTAVAGGLGPSKNSSLE